MTIGFETIELGDMGDRTNRPDLMWAYLYLHLEDHSLDHKPTVRVRLPVTRRPETTMRDIETEARDRAVTYLRAALALLEANSIAELAERQAAQRVHYPPVVLPPSI
ncbi:MAG: hypothetical protein K2X74_17610 [Acetobacteraceae bacterium]|nr:hypothetical protein [Acetobacteraceae bacterium]